LCGFRYNDECKDYILVQIIQKKIKYLLNYSLDVENANSYFG